VGADGGIVDLVQDLLVVEDEDEQVDGRLDTGVKASLMFIEGPSRARPGGG
jgi:hypothetical protein